MTPGNSSSGFDPDTFSACAFLGATALATAIVAGIMNARANNWAGWSRQALTSGLEFSELRRAQVYQRLQVSNRRVSDLQSEVIRLRAELKAERARQLLRTRRLALSASPATHRSTATAPSGARREL
jgi:hypothetical protein